MRTNDRLPKLFVGVLLRHVREARRLSQAALARRVGLSPSYLNQIERDGRPLPRRMISVFCAELGVEVTYFDNADELRIAHDLREASADPAFGALPLTLDAAIAAVRHAPEFGNRFLALYRAFIAEREKTAVRTPDDLRRAVAAGQPYDEVRDWVQMHRNHFEGLDHQAESLADRINIRSGIDRLSRLVSYLQATHGLAVEMDAALLGSGQVWRLQRGRRRLLLADGTREESRTFWIAHVIGLLEQRRMIERLVSEAAFSGDEARALARVSLANYYAGALLMPYCSFLETAREVRYDVERLQFRFKASFEQVCHRLSTLQRPGLTGIPFFFLKTDIAGNELKRSSATRFQFARFGGPCPLWNVYTAFTRRGQVIVGLARTPDDITYLNIARTVGGGGDHYLARPRSVAVILGCELDYAPLTVYAAGIDLGNPETAVPIGPGCRTCERIECRHRAVPPLGRMLDVGTLERGVVPYKII